MQNITFQSNKYISIINNSPPKSFMIVLSAISILSGIGAQFLAVKSMQLAINGIVTSLAVTSCTVIPLTMIGTICLLVGIIIFGAAFEIDKKKKSFREKIEKMDSLDVAEDIISIRNYLKNPGQIEEFTLIKLKKYQQLLEYRLFEELVNKENNILCMTAASSEDIAKFIETCNTKPLSSLYGKKFSLEKIKEYSNSLIEF